MNIAVSGQVLCEKYPLGEALAFIKQQGCSGIEIWPTCIEQGVQSYGNFSAEQLYAAKEKLDKFGIEAVCVSCACAFDEDLGNDSSAYAKELCAAVEAARILGAGLVNHYCYYLSLHNLEEENLVNAMTPGLKLAEEYGITLVLENEAHDMTRTPEGTKRILRLFDGPNFKTNYDATNYYHARQEGFPKAYDVLKDDIAYIHLKNGKMEEDIVYTSIVDGAVNIDGVVKRSIADQYSGFYTLEPHCPQEQIEQWLIRDIQYVKEIKV